MPTYNGQSATKSVSSEEAFYDAGGQDGDAKAWHDKAVVLKPEAGKLIEITFTEVSLNADAYISIFNGAKALDEYNDGLGTSYSVPSGERMKIEGGATVPIVLQGVAPSKPITVMIHSEGDPGAGFVAKVKSVDAPPAVPVDAPAEVRISEMPKIYLVGQTAVDFYDDGGKDGKISEKFEGYVTFKPKDPTKFVKITFSKLDLFDTSWDKDRNDKLEIFKGESTKAEDLIKDLSKKSKETPILVKSVEAGQGITVKLKSTTGVTKSGWEAKVVEFTPSPMEFREVASSVGEEGDVSASTEGVKMMNFTVKTEFALDPLTLDKVKLNLGTDYAIVKAVKLYGFEASGDEKLLASATNLASAEVELTLDEAFALAEGETKFFVAYDVADTAENGKKLSAQLQAVTLKGTEHTATGSTAFERTIKNVYYSKVGTSEQKIVGDWEFTHTPASKWSKKYKANNSDEIVTFLPANAGEKVEIDFKDFAVYMSSRSYGTKAKFIIYNGEGTSGTILWEATTDNKDKGPEKLIRSTSPDGAITVLFNSKTTRSYETATGWHATVRSYKSSPMILEALELAQVDKDKPVVPSKENQPILSLNFKTAKDLNPIHLTGLKLNLKGSEGQLNSVKLYATDAQGEFATDNLLATITPASGSVAVSFDKTLLEGNNFLWLCYDLKEGVPSDTPFDAKVEAYTLSTSGETAVDASLGDPEGERISKNIYLLEAGTEIKDLRVTSSLLFYDDGGKDGNRTKGFKGAVHFIPNDGEVIKLVFKTKQELYSSDKLIIYNGKSRDEADKLLKVKSYKKPEEPILSKAADGSLTVDFSASKSGEKAGWEIEVISYQLQPLSLESVASAQATTDTEVLAGAETPFITLTANVVGDKDELAPLQSIKVETTGTTDLADIEKLLVYATDQPAEFTEANLIGEALPSAELITIDQEKSKVSAVGEYKYTLVAQVKGSAVAGNTIALKVTEVNTNPVTGAVLASRTVKEGLKGTYTVGSSAEATYENFAKALEALEGGVSGAVVLEVEDGTYPKLEIPAIKGLSETNTLTIRPKSGELGRVIFENNTAKPSGYSSSPKKDYSVIELNNTSFINLEKLVVQTAQKDYDGVIFIKSSPNVSIKGCKVVAPRGITFADDVVLIRSKGNGLHKVNLGDNLSIEDCELVGGRHGIYLDAKTFIADAPQKNVKIKGNRLKNQGSVAIYSRRVQDLLIENNQITGNGEAGNDYFAMDIVLMEDITIKNNVIEAYGMTKTKNNLTIAGLHFRKAVTADWGKYTGANAVINNTIRLVPETDQEAYALYFAASDISNLTIAHNTVKIIAPNSTDQIEDTAIVKVEGGSQKTFANVQFYGNLFQNLAEGFAYEVFGSWDGSGVAFDYNAVFASTTKFAHLGTEDKTYEEWKTAVSGVAHDKTEKATFRSFSSMELDEEGSFNYVPTAGEDQKYDIVGKERKNPSTAGAYEFVEGTMPVFADDFPKLAESTSETAKISVKATASGQMFYIVKKKDEPAPTLEEVANSTTFINFETNTSVDLPLGSLEEETEYKIYTLLVSPRGEKAAALKTLDFATKKKEIAPLQLVLADSQGSVSKGETVHLEATISGGLAPFTYQWTNAKNEVVSTAQAFDYAPQISQVLNLVVTDAQGTEVKGITALHVKDVNAVATFEDLYLANESFWAPKATMNFFSGSYMFNYDYNSDWDSWNGVSYTNSTTTTFDRNNYIAEQYNSVVGSGVDGSSNYGVVYGNSTLTVNNQEEGEVLNGFYITNTANTILCVNTGTGFGDIVPFAQGDFSKLTVTADNGNTLDYYLADYRSDNPDERYAVKTWAYLDLSSLGKVKNVKFSFSSSRNNQWGNLMPAYFCVDNVGAKPQVTDVPVDARRAIPATFDLHTLLDDKLPAEWVGVVKFSLRGEANASVTDLALNANMLSFKTTAEGNFKVGVIAQGHGETKFFNIDITSGPKYPTAVESLDKGGLKLYPNPAVRSVKLNKSGVLRIYNLRGQIVLESDYEAGTTLDIDSLPAGTYLVKLGAEVQRLIKQ